MGSPVNHGDQAPPRVGRLCANYSVTSRAALVRIAMKSVYLAEGHGLPRSLDADFTASLGGHGHEK